LAGISDAFEELLKLLPGGFDRSCYGISYEKDGEFVYNATALEIYDDEAEKYNCDRYIIRKGQYLTQTLRDWRSKTDMIKDIFQVMMGDGRVDQRMPCVEWYRTDHEMFCMVMMNQMKL
jgi:hypothetical protein